VVRHVIEF